MLEKLRLHPFAVEARFEGSLVLTYAVPKEELAGMIPECLELDLFQDKWAFIAVALVKTAQLRPKGFPTWLGNDFTLAGFRIFVRYTNDKGRRLRGLYIMRSETDSRKMEFLGNFFTRYKYARTDISYVRNSEHVTIVSIQSGIRIEGRITNELAELPLQSPFSDWKEARRYAGPLPFTFSYNPSTREVLIVEGVRHNWLPMPFQVDKAVVGFINNLGLNDLRLANAFFVEGIDYYWKGGRTEKWKN